MILSLDLGTKTGWSIYENPNAIYSGTWSFKTERFEGGGMRFLRFRAKLEEAYQLQPVRLVVYEEVRRHLGTTAAHIYGGLQATLTSWCESIKLPYYAVPVGTIKQHGTGRANAPKSDMVKAAKRIFPTQNVESEDQADSLVLLDYAVKQFRNSLQLRDTKSLNAIGNFDFE
jgi:crossover junction endodeoxyribonuclease RuvC